MVPCLLQFSGFGPGRASLVWSFLQTAISHVQRAPRPLRARAVLSCGVLLAAFTVGAAAQTIGVREWRGTAALTRHPEQVFASTTAEWRGLWSRVGLAAPVDQFEPGRNTAVGIFLGARAGTGYSINIISTNRRHDRIMVVFEERAPADIMMAQRMPPPPTTRPVASAPGFMPGASASFAPQGLASLPPPTSHPVGPITSPWAIVLINRADLPVTVEQRLFR